MAFTRVRRMVHICLMAGIFCGLATLLVSGKPAIAQQSLVKMQHLDLQQMSGADRRALQANRSAIMESAEIYGYDLVTGNWTVRQTLCPPLPNTILLHYRQRFPDGTESLFTALVPRGKGSVRIVPVLHRNATPYVPAPRNPRNYALFNSLVPLSIAQQALASSHNWIELSACYAEMTGASIDIPEGGSVDAGVAGAPTATIQLDARHKTSLVTIADRESREAFRVWSISFNHRGRVTAAGTQDYPVILRSRVAHPAAVATGTPETKSAPLPVVQPAEASTAAAPRSEPPAAPSASEALPTTSALASGSTPKPEAPTKTVAQTSQGVTIRAGWKFIPEPPPPPSKFIPQAPPPRSKVVPQPQNK